MPRLKTYLIALLALSTAVLGWLAYQQHLELVALRASGLSNEERLTWQKRVWDLERAKTQAASPEEGLAKGDSETAATQRNEADPRDRGRRGPPGMEAMMSVMNSPDFMKLVSTQQRGLIENRFAALFRKLSLTPAEREKLKALIAEKQNVMMDVMAAAREQGIGGRESRDQIRSMVETAQGEVDASIKSVLGDQRYAEYSAYESSLSQRTTVNQLAERLSYTQTPLSTQQTEQLITLLAAEGTPAPAPGAGGPGGRGGMDLLMSSGGAFVPPAQVSSTALQQAQGILSQPQLEVLQQIQSEQQAQDQMNRLIRDTMRRGGTGTRGTPQAPGS